jgi:hypothetical protein
LVFGIWYLVLDLSSQREHLNTVRIPSSSQLRINIIKITEKASRPACAPRPLEQALQTQLVEDFKAVGSEATKQRQQGRGRLARRGRCNKAHQSKLVEDFKAVWSGATKIKDPVIKGVKPGLGCGEMLSRVQAD